MLLSSLSENLLTLLCFDDTRAPIIRGTVDPALFGGIHREIVARVYDYIDRYKKPPKDHLPDLFPDKIEGANQRSATLYTDVFESVYAAKDGINAEYVMTQLETFVDRQSLRSIAIDLTKELQRDTDASLEKAKQLIAGATRNSLSLFDAGTRLSDKSKALKFLETTTEAFPTGIPELDKRGFGPTRKELWLYIANSKSGKSWGLIQLAKMALLHRLKVCHITLEMSEERSAQRYMQTLFAISKRKEVFRTTKFQLDDLGRIAGFDEVKVKPSLSLDDPDIRKKLGRRIDRFAPRFLDNIFIKQFPTGQLTLQQLIAYLDNLESTDRFTPDLLIVDYPDLMKLDADNFRLALDALYKGLRGVAVSRNIALAVVSQSNRGGKKVKQLDSDDVAEAYSKIMHADTIITYSQSVHEKQLGLARLYVSGGRNDEDKITIVISQQYGLGGFVIDSAMMRGNYHGLVPRAATEDEV